MTEPKCVQSQEDQAMEAKKFHQQTLYCLNSVQLCRFLIQEYGTGERRKQRCAFKNRTAVNVSLIFVISRQSKICEKSH